MAKSHQQQTLYRDLPKLSTKVRQRRMRLAGHCVRHQDEIASKIVLWQPTEGKRSRGRRCITFVDNLLEDTGLDNTREIQTAMMNREGGRRRVEEMGRPNGRPR